MNLLKETLSAIQTSGHTPADIAFIGTLTSPPRSCTWEQFETRANRDYNSGYGGQEVRGDLVILFDDGSRLERREYDGSEWWQFVPVVVIPENAQVLSYIFNRERWDEEDLEEARKESEDQFQVEEDKYEAFLDSKWEGYV